ncbi:MAG: hypothetical protein RIR26_2217 [Pseudomonadota bacterium]|jgi:hypothetical protein
MPNSSPLQHEKGVALTELLLLAPLIFVLLEGFLLLSDAMTAGLQSKTQQIQREFDRALAEATHFAFDRICSNPSPPRPRLAEVTVSPPSSPDLPATFSQQRLLFLSASRAACLAEGATLLGLPTASALFTALSLAPQESAGQAIALRLCPATAKSTQSLRTLMVSAMHLTSQGESFLVLNLTREATPACSH